MPYCVSGMAFCFHISKYFLKVDTKGGGKMIKRKRKGYIKELFGILITIVIISNSADVLAGNGPVGRDWRTSDELIQNKEIQEPSQILQVDFCYDADALPFLKVVKAVVKHGYAPKYALFDSGYNLIIKSLEGDIVLSQLFQIPNTVFDPPPEAGDVSKNAPFKLPKMDFSITVLLPGNAAELVIADPQGAIIFRQNISELTVQKNRPAFRTLPPNNSAPRSLNLPKSGKTNWLCALITDIFIATAEASTSDGTALDVTFVGDNYTDVDLARFHQDVDNVITHMMTYEPFVSRADQVVFHTVDNTAVDLECYHDVNVSRLMTCNNSTVFSVLNNAGAPYDKVIVLVKDSVYGGSATMPDMVAVSYNGISLPQVGVHEFGHTLKLNDEYNITASNGPINNTTYANCYAGNPPCASWDGLVSASDYSLGCYYPNWYRSSPCSIMLQLDCMYFNNVSKRILDSDITYYAGPAKPTLTFSAAPLTIGLSGQSTLSWSSLNANSCIASGAWSGAKSLNGEEIVAPGVTSSYTLACSGATGSINQTVTVTVDTQVPIAAITSPVNGAVLTGSSAKISVTSTDDLNVKNVEFYKDSILLGADNATPYELIWNIAAEASGSHTLVAKAYDDAGNVGTSASVTVNIAGDTIAPQVSILSPANNNKVSGKVTIKASATDNIAVTRMELYIDGALKTSVTTGSLTYVWNVTKGVSAGSHIIIVKGYDAKGNIGTASITVIK